MSSEPLSAFSLQSYLTVLRRQRRLIIVVIVVMVGLSMLPSLVQAPVYAATAQIRVAALDDEGVFSSDAGGVDLATERTVDLLTEMEILGSEPMRARVLETFVERPEFTGPAVSQRNFSEVVDVTVTAADAATASDVANRYADVFVEERRTRSVETLEAKAAELRGQSAAAQDELESIAARLAVEDLDTNAVANLQLRQATLSEQVLDFDRRADELAVNASLRGNATQVHEYADLDLSPIRSSPIGAGAIGFVIGGLLGLAIAVVVDTVQDKVGSREDLASVRPESPILAVVPHREGELLDTADPTVQEAFRYLRTGIRVFGLNSRLRSVLITSAVGAEGKTTTAVNLAIAMAEAGDRVVLVDVDLRRPNVHAAFDLSNRVGISSVLVGDAPLEDAVHFVRDNLAVVPAGPPVQNPTQVLGSRQFQEIMEALVQQSDFVVVDSPPVLPVADALIAGQHVDGAVAVGRIGAVRRRAVRELLSRLEEADIPVIGLLANDTTAETPYGYYSNKGDRQSPVRTSG